MKIKHKKKVASTNDWARDYAAGGGALPKAFRADEQTAGRGTRGNSWVSPPGWTYLSIAFTPPAKEATELTLLVAETLRDILTKSAVGIYWVKPPNDVYRRDEKVAGILMEQTKDALVIGIGIDHAPDELARQVVDAVEDLYMRWLAGVIEE
ncbi:MAG: biotin--[acetyl-CoA-carboxylase] ligase [Coriobacteriia bacterium]|nr:biotin--[acetyl-CoA-carboxylase] ligase [Coriobacteriia bacterium]